MLRCNPRRGSSLGLGIHMAAKNARGARLRFDSFSLEEFPDGRCRAEVDLEWDSENAYKGVAEGTSTVEGSMRASAEATLRAINEATEDELSLHLSGVKAMRAFDVWIVIIAARGEKDGEVIRLVGSSSSSPEEKPRGAVLASLDATNRLVAMHVARV